MSSKTGWSVTHSRENHRLRFPTENESLLPILYCSYCNVFMLRYLVSSNDTTLSTFIKQSCSANVSSWLGSCGIVGAFFVTRFVNIRMVPTGFVLRPQSDTSEFAATSISSEPGQPGTHSTSMCLESPLLRWRLGTFAEHRG